MNTIPQTRNLVILDISFSLTCHIQPITKFCEFQLQIYLKSFLPVFPNSTDPDLSQNHHLMLLGLCNRFLNSPPCYKGSLIALRKWGQIGYQILLFYFKVGGCLLLNLE